jgi:hypothetical protein
MHWRLVESPPSPNAMLVSQGRNGCSYVAEPSSPSEVVCAFYSMAEKGSIEGAMSYQTDLITVPHDKDAKSERKIVSVKLFDKPTRAKQIYGARSSCEDRR